MSHDPKFQQQPPKDGNVYIRSNRDYPPQYQEDRQQHKVPSLLESRENNQNVKQKNLTFNVPTSVIEDEIIVVHENKATPVRQEYNPVYRQTKPKRTLANQDSVQLPCNHYKPPPNQIKTWMFDGFREWCPYCNQLTNGENLIRSGQKLSGLARFKLELSEVNQPNMEFEDDEGNESDVDESYTNQGYERFNNPPDDSNPWPMFKEQMNRENREAAKVQNMTEKYQGIHVSRPRMTHQQWMNETVTIRPAHGERQHKPPPENRVRPYQAEIRTYPLDNEVESKYYIDGIGDYGREFDGPRW